MSSFTYSPLSHPREIRVLTLVGGRDGDTLEGSMRHIRLSENSPQVQQNPQSTAMWPSNFSSPSTFGGYESYSFPDNGGDGGDKGDGVWTWKFHGAETIRLKSKLAKMGTGMKIIESAQLSYKFSCERATYGVKEYDALSYTWGDPTKTHEMHIDGLTLPITRNLHTALMRLRSENSTRVLWVDAICIDQQNTQERNHQVHMMKMIFSMASSVLVWLGDLGSAGSKALNMVVEYNWRNGNKDVLGYKPETLQGISKLFGQDWWMRIWIVQEVVAARRLVVLSGHKTIPWSFFRSFCYAIQSKEFHAHLNAQFLRQCGYTRFTALDNFRKNKAMPLSRFMQCTRNYHATDPRDKLYALLGMASDIAGNELLPDYTKSVEEVYRELVKFMVTKQHGLNIISSGQLKTSKQGTPTWFPDWRILDTIKPLNSEEQGGHFYRAGGDERPVVDMSGFPSALLVEGVVVDKIDVFGGDITFAQESLSTLHRWHYIATQNLPTKSGLFWRTIVADKDNVGRLATPAFGELFEAFINQSTMTPSSDSPVQRFADAVTRAVMGRKFFITKKGKMGLGPRDVQIKDRIVVLKGCGVPLIMRNVKDHMVLVGEAYVSGIMNGEVMNDVARRQYKTRMIMLK